MSLNIESGCMAVQKVLAGLEENKSYDAALLPPLLNVFVSTMGFSNARFYNVVFNVPQNDDVLIFTNAAGPGAAAYPVGKPILYKNSTLGRANSHDDPVVDDYQSAQAAPNCPKWVDELLLTGKCWVDIPLWYGGVMMGVIACDWEGKKSDLTSHDLAMLKMASSVVAARLSVMPREMIKKAMDIIDSARAEADSTSDLLTRSLNGLTGLLNIGGTAVFEYEWYAERLNKIAEIIHPRYLDRAHAFPESYAVGEYLTGDAWGNETYRYISDFPSLCEREAYKVFQPSLDRHVALFGEITSTLYYVVGSREARYLVRFMNRADVPELPLLSSHLNMLRTILGDLSDAVDDLTAQRRMRSLQDILRVSVENVGKANACIGIVHETLSNEHFSAVAILSHCEGGTYFSHEYYLGTLYDEWRLSAEHRHSECGENRSSAPIKWSDVDIYVKARESGKPMIVEIGALASHTNPDTMSGYLYSRNIRSILCIPFSATRTKGVLLCPLQQTHPPKNKPSLSMLQKKEPEKWALLTSLAATVGTMVEAADSHVSAEKARQVVAHIGHEVTTPATILSQAALDSVLEIQERSGDDDKELNAFLEGCKRKIKQEMQAVGKAMEIALIVAQQNQRLRLHYKKCNLGELLSQCRDAVNRDYNVYGPDGELRPYEIVLSDACYRLGDVVADASLMKLVFVNLLKNATKYSLPRYPNTPMRITVNAEPQNRLAIMQFKNWGFGIPKDEYETIFRPYVRGSVTDTKKVIRGMGLGLYIARQIMIAHKGAAFCKSSVQMLDYAKHRDNYEGYETVFEVRLPHGLAEGLSEYIWEDWS